MHFPYNVIMYTKCMCVKYRNDYVEFDLVYRNLNTAAIFDTDRP